MKKLSKKQQACKDAFLKYPTKSDNEIAKIIGVSQPVVSKYRREHDLAIDTEFIAITAGKFIHEFSQASDHWKVLIEELEALKNGKKTIIKQNAETGGFFKSEVDLEPLDKLQIIREQANLRSRILFLASQGEVREVIKVMRSGQLPSLTQ